MRCSKNLLSRRWLSLLVSIFQINTILILHNPVTHYAMKSTLRVIIMVEISITDSLNARKEFSFASVWKRI